METPYITLGLSLCIHIGLGTMSTKQGKSHAFIFNQGHACCLRGGGKPYLCSVNFVILGYKQVQILVHRYLWVTCIY